MIEMVIWLVVIAAFVFRALKKNGTLDELFAGAKKRKENKAERVVYEQPEEGSGKKEKKKKGPGIRVPKHTGLAVTAVVIVLAAAVLSFDSFYTLSEEEMAVVTTFGKPAVEEASGLHFKIPVIQRVTKVSKAITGMQIGYTTDPAIDGVTPVVNAFDTYALEMAVRLKEAAGGEVTVLSIGDESVKNSLKNCLAVGADYAYLAANDAYQSADPEIIAKELKAAKEAIEEKTGKKFDIVFCGKETTDFASGQVGTILAKELSAPVTADVVDITAGEGKVTVKQETEEGYCMIESGLPCVVAVNKPEYDPRYPTIKSKMAARKKPIEELAAEEAGSAQVEVLRVYAPAKRAAGVKIKAEDPAEAVSQALAMMSEAKAI